MKENSKIIVYHGTTSLIKTIDVTKVSHIKILDADFICLSQENIL